MNANIKSWPLGEIHLFTKITSHLDIIVSSLIISHHFIQTSSGHDTSEVRCTRSTRSHHPADNTLSFFGMAAPHRTLRDNEDHSRGFQSEQDDMRYCRFFSFHCNKKTQVGSATDYFPHYKENKLQTGTCF